MTPKVLRKARSKPGSASAFFVLLLLVPVCANAAETLTAHMAAVDASCRSQTWPTEVALVDCLNPMERAVLQRDAPIAVQAFETFAAKRRWLAQRFDAENIPGRAAWSRYEQGVAEAAAVLAAHEPRFFDKNSRLWQELDSAHPVCTSKIIADVMKCTGSIIRPIWQRDAPNTIAYYDAYQRKRIQLAREYDIVGAPKIASANELLANGMKEAFAEFMSTAQQAVQQQQAAVAQSAAQQAESAQTLIAIGQLAGAFLQGVAIAAQARANAVPMTIQTVPQQPTHTNCQTIGHQTYCTTTTY